MKILLAVTTFNQLEYTKKFINTIPEITIPGLDIMFFDDVSTDGTQDFIKSQGYKIFERKTPMGLTKSWNMAYEIFKTQNYDILILSNNDVLLNQTGLLNLINSAKDVQLSCPLTTKLGAGHNWENQTVTKHYPTLKIDVNNSVNHKKVQSSLKYKTLEMNKFNGFIFAMSRKIITAEYDKNNLFNPGNINVHQEGDLQSRMKTKPIVCLGSFIFHYKGVSFPIKGVKNGKDVRQDLKLYHK